MDDMDSKNILNCTVSYTALPLKFAPLTKTVLATSIQHSFVFFSEKLFETWLHWHSFFQDVPHIQKTFKYIKTDTYIFYGSY